MGGTDGPPQAISGRPAAGAAGRVHPWGRVCRAQGPWPVDPVFPVIRDFLAVTLFFGGIMAIIFFLLLIEVDGQVYVVDRQLTGEDCIKLAEDYAPSVEVSCKRDIWGK